MILGAVVAVLSIVVGVVLAVVGLRPATRIEAKSIPVAGPGNSVEHHFDADEKIVLYTPGTNGPYQESPPRCSITGGSVSQTATPNSSVTLSGVNQVSFAAYTIATAGTYRITCDRSGVTIAPPLSVGGILGGVGGILLAVFGGLVGLVMFVVGLVVTLARRRTPRAPGPQGFASGPVPPNRAG